MASWLVARFPGCEVTGYRLCVWYCSSSGCVYVVVRLSGYVYVIVVCLAMCMVL